MASAYSSLGCGALALPTGSCHSLESPSWTPGAPPKPYRNRVAIAFDFRGDQVCGYREYFGSDGASY